MFDPKNKNKKKFNFGLVSVPARRRRRRTAGWVGRPPVGELPRGERRRTHGRCLGLRGGFGPGRARAGPCRAAIMMPAVAARGRAATQALPESDAQAGGPE